MAVNFLGILGQHRKLGCDDGTCVRLRDVAPHSSAGPAQMETNQVQGDIVCIVADSQSHRTDLCKSAEHCSRMVRK
jgi:hypothetical protein